MYIIELNCLFGDSRGESQKISASNADIMIDINSERGIGLNNESVDSGCFNEVYETLAGVIGIDSMLKVYEVFKGQQVNFPVKLFSKNYVLETVLKTYNGHNLSRLATKYGYSERHLRHLMKQRLEEDD